MAFFLKNVAFHGILLDALFEEGNREWEEVSQLLQEGITTGVVQPLQTTVFTRDKVEQAFRYMAQGKHIGKVLLQVNLLFDCDGIRPSTSQISPCFCPVTVILTVSCSFYADPLWGTGSGPSACLPSVSPSYLSHFLPCISLLHHHWRTRGFRSGARPVADWTRSQKTGADE